MSQYDDELKKFEKAILARANKEKDEIINEIDELQKEENDKTREEILTNTAQNLKQELAELEADFKIKLSKKSIEYHQSIIKKRNQLADKVFADAEKSLKDFSLTADYKAALVKAADSIGKDYCYEGWNIMMLKKDESIANDVATAFGNNATVVFSEDFEIGGFLLYNTVKSIVIDQSYSKLLENQRSWFTANSGLEISMRERE